MSGHSHFATIKRQKEAKDAARGNIFSKLARAITIAAKSGGGPDPDSNFKLRIAIDKARGYNMPKDNIERAISKAAGSDSLEEVTYEGFGPGGIGVIVQVATDNRNRAGQEIKNIFERAGGSLGGPGSVSFNFEPLGLILVAKEADSQSQILNLIDTGCIDCEETDDAIEVYTNSDKLAVVRKEIEKLKFKIISSELILKPKNEITLDENQTKKALALLDTLEEHDDVQKVFTNLGLQAN